jgi:apoptosis-inducing factor 2
MRAAIATPSLMPGYSDKLAGTLAAQLRSKGVSLRFNRRVENLAARDGPFLGNLGEDLGEASERLIFPALGARPQEGTSRGCCFGKLC